MFSASIGAIVYACPLYSTSQCQVFEIVTHPSFDNQFRPLSQVLLESFVPDSSSTVVFSLEWMPCYFRTDRVGIRVLGAEVAPARCGTPSDPNVCRQRKVVQEDPEDKVAERVFEENLDLLEHVDELEARDSECESVCSSDDSSCDIDASESAAGHSADEDSDEAVAGFRAASGSYVVHCNGYFTFTDHPKYQDVKVTVMPRWCHVQFLDTSHKSKTVTVAHFAEPRANPQRSMWVLKACMLWKAHENNFCNERSARRRLFAQEAQDLRKQIVAASSSSAPTTGNAAADALIHQWAPAVLAQS